MKGRNPDDPITCLGLPEANLLSISSKYWHSPFNLIKPAFGWQAGDGMTGEGRYLYCLIEGTHEGNFRSSGVGNGRVDVRAVSYKDISAVVSESRMDLIRATAENCMRHEKVLEEVVQHRHTLLPFEFGTVAPDEEAVQATLRDNYSQIRNAFKKISGRIEVNVKALWRDMKTVFQEILQEHKMIAHYKAEIAKKPFDATYPDRIKIGQMTSEALREKKEREAERLIHPLKRHAKELMRGPTFGDEMIMNVSFLLPREKKEPFEKDVHTLGDQYEGKIDFKYEDERPPYSFVNLNLRVKT